MRAIEIFRAIVTALADIPLDAEADPSGEKLFEAGALGANKQLGKQMTEALALKSRAFLVVPVSIHRDVADDSGGLSVMGRKWAEVAIIYSDVAYFKGTQTVTFGGDKNLGLLGFDEKIEAALTGREVSPFGGIVLGDSTPLLLTESEQKDAPGRTAWLVMAYVPIGLIAAAVG